MNLVNCPSQAASWTWFFNSFHFDRFDRAVCLESLNRHLQLSKQRVPSPKTLERDVVPGRNLCSYKGGLYCLISERSRQRQNRPVCLARLWLDRKEPLEILRRLPATATDFQFDGGYLYYTSPDQVRDAWQTITDDDAGARAGTTLYRVPLPR